MRTRARCWLYVVERWPRPGTRHQQVQERAAAVDIGSLLTDTGIKDSPQCRIGR